MQRKLLVASVAAIPLLAFAHGTFAETTVTTAVTTPVKTSDTATDDAVRVTSTGSIKPTVAGPALLMDTGHDITNEGAISTTGVNGSVGMASDGGLVGDILNKGTIQIVEDYTPPNTEPKENDTDEVGDTDLDGGVEEAFAKGTGRYGIRVEAGGMTGFVNNEAGASITVEGNQSYGIRLEGGLLGATGNLTNRGSVSVTGNESFGIQTVGDVAGKIEIRGSVSTLGRNSTAVAIDGDVGGMVQIQGGLSSRGYRFAARPTDEIIAKLDADDLMQGGPALRIAGNVVGGILIDKPPVIDEENEEDKDQDDDGVEDAKEVTGAISVLGSAPAMLIGSASESITIGAVGPGDRAYGLVDFGAITADGIYDNAHATGLQIGGAGGTTTTLTGGARLAGTVTVRGVGKYTYAEVGAPDALATGVRLGSGATLTGALLNEGTINVQATNVSAPTPVTGLPLLGEQGQRAYGVHIEAGASAPTLTNTGVLSAAVLGERGRAVAVIDESGSVRTITNSGRIQAVIVPTDDAKDTDDADLDPSNETISDAVVGGVPVTQRVAIDVRAATAGVAIVQNDKGDDGDDLEDEIDDPDDDDDGIDNADEPVILGDIRTGAFNDSVTLNNGSMTGNIDFGAGANTLALNGGASFLGWIDNTEANDDLTLNINNGSLKLTKIGEIHGKSASFGADGSLFVTISAVETAPGVLDSTRLIVDSASFAEGAQLGVSVQGLIDFDDFADTREFLIVDATTLASAQLDDSLLTATPYIYDIHTVVDAAGADLKLVVGRRTAEAIGFNAEQAVAYDAIYRALLTDEDVRDAILLRTNRAAFLDLYNQLLPDTLEGLFSSLEMAQISISRATATRPDLRQRYGPDSFWIQELNMQVNRDGGETLGSESKGFGFVGGYESMGEDGGALGATLAYVTAEETDDAAKVGEQTTVSQLEGGLYWRRSAGSWLFSVRGGGGFAWFDGTRRFLDPVTRLIREGEADWTGWTGSAHASVGYEARFGRYFVRPTAAVDYFYLSEGDRQEEGAEDFNQTVAERSSSRLSSTIEVAFGGEYGRDVWWRPEVRLGYRQILGGELGDTVVNFPGGTPFTVSAMEPGDGAAIVALAIKMGTPMSYLALEGEMEAADGEQRYNLNLNGRVMF